MPLVTTREIMEIATEKGYAIGAFNILNELTARAVVRASEELAAPVILQTSVSTVQQIGVEYLAGVLRILGTNAKVPVAIHLDHCREPALAIACVDAGWTSVMLDASHLPLHENIALTRQVADYARNKGVSVEGELGAVGGVEDQINVSLNEAHLVNVADAAVYAHESGIDIFAPAIGTAHGLYRGTPELDYERFRAIRKVVPLPMVIHGGTGLSAEAFLKLIEMGASKINISTALKQTYLCSAREFLVRRSQETDPLRLDAHVERAIREMVKEHIALFGTKGRYMARKAR
ncbi:MAG: class II fructose-bisphosphate aldolase [Syntrophomonadaceae bacterium]|nr:class II fructose-bisphosphate aldolase [Syntrophomonadaceae bacterium]